MARANGISSDVALRDKAKAFLEIAARSVLLDADEITGAVKNGPGFHLAHGVYFVRRDEALQAQHELVRPVLRKLGLLRGNEKELQGLSWQHAGLWVQSAKSKGVDSAAQALLKAMEEAGSEALDLFLPNYTFKLVPEVSYVRLGKVDIDHSTAAVLAAAPFAKTLRV